MVKLEKDTIILTEEEDETIRSTTEKIDRCINYDTRLLLGLGLGLGGLLLGIKSMRVEKETVNNERIPEYEVIE